MRSYGELTVGVCSIGSGVGQSVIDSCNLSPLPVRTVGLGNSEFAFGLYDCDDYAFIPSYYADNYIEKLLAICSEKGIQLIIPGHDDEAQRLAEHYEQFRQAGIELLVADAEFIKICRAKESMVQHFPTLSEFFVKSYTLSELQTADSELANVVPLIAKPRDGFASKGISIIRSENDLIGLDESFIYQEIAIPRVDDPTALKFKNALAKGQNMQVAEISIQLLIDKQGAVQAEFTSYNKLNNGIPIEIVPFQDKEVDRVINLLAPLMVDKGLRGPINIQGRLTDSGFKIFELNPRFTGITGLRAQFGFNEVEACIRHFGFYEPLPQITYNPNRVGIRQTKNRTVEVANYSQLSTVVSAIQKHKSAQRTILVTGSTGSVGRRVVAGLIERPGLNVWTLDRDGSKAAALHANEHIQSFSWSDLFEKHSLNLGLVDTLCHLAAARPHHGAAEIAESTQFTAKLFTNAAAAGIENIIYASSQSVYAQSDEALINESHAVAPASIYAQSKYFGEVMLAQLAEIYPSFNYLTLRLSTLTGKDVGISDVEAVAKLSKRLLLDLPVTIEGGEQKLSRLDIEDAAKAIITAICDFRSRQSEVYNVGSDVGYSINEIVNMIQEILRVEFKRKVFNVAHSPLTGKPDLKILDSTSFSRDFGWEPKKKLRRTIIELLKTLKGS